MSAFLHILNATCFTREHIKMWLDLDEGCYEEID